MKALLFVKALCLLTTTHITAFSPNSYSYTQNIQTKRIFNPSSRSPQISYERIQSKYLRAQTDESDGFFSNITINPIYAIPYLLFIAVGTYMTNAEPTGASNELIQKFIADPLHPNLGSSLFETVFNCLGLVGFPLACLIMPGAKFQKFNPTPFLIGSAAAGYGSLGLMMTTRTPVPTVEIEDLGWFTKNVLENKIFNWLLFAALLNTYILSGSGLGLLTDAGTTLSDFQELISGSALGLVSTLDLTILCLTGASLVPEDLERRGVTDRTKANAIAASTLLLPVVGLALYSALRPSLEQD